MLLSGPRGDGDALPGIRDPEGPPGRGATEGHKVSALENLEAHTQSPAPSGVVTGESYCRCELQPAPRGPGAARQTPDPKAGCLCGEEDDGFEWTWEPTAGPSGVSLSCQGRTARFHGDYSSGTAAVRGNRALVGGQHYWEVKMTSPVFGTDMMVGVGTLEVDLNKFRHSFCSLLGHDEDSWGLSYKGLLQHAGTKEKFSPRFGQGSIIGVHLDSWHGTLTFYRNRHCIGVATTRLPNKAFYPMVCSTAAKSSVKVIRACFCPTSLQYLCCARIGSQMPGRPDALWALGLPPGLLRLLQSRLGWVFSLSQGRQLQPRDPLVEGLPQD